MIEGETVYHIGIAEHLIIAGKSGVVGADKSIQSVVKMWDGNLLILSVGEGIGAKIKKGDYVLVDYTPLSPDSRNKKLQIIKILPQNEGSKIWAYFQDEIERRQALLRQQRNVR